MLVAPTNVLFFLHSGDSVDFSNWKKGSIGVWAPIFTETQGRDASLRKSSQLAWCASKRLPIN